MSCGEQSLILVEFNEASTVANIMDDAREAYLKPMPPITLAACTWNVNNSAPGPGALRWVKAKYKSAEVYVVGLQEVDLRKRAMVTDAAMQVGVRL